MRDALLRHPDWLAPAWDVARVGALMTTRHGGVSMAPFDSLNLRAAVGDDPPAVAENQRRLAQAIGARPVFLNQVHGAAVAHLSAADVRAGAALHTADASVTTEPGVGCAVQVADCLPVLFAAPQGRAVGAAHAGWRGLALGVLEATLAAVCAAAQCEPGEVQAWLGAGIGPAHFEVGPDVLEAFGASAAGSPRFVARQPGKWLADLPALARDRLQAAGVRAVSGGDWCTVADASRFFSFRRDRVTGRMAAVVWIEATQGR
ncbi:MAG TPA: peptidoglycan editing factor PgeF [Burkholderiaceae bacterium]|nr:peptidoglycan editing factor PgeF [Burkholderiaceae bacterium]